MKKILKAIYCISIVILLCVPSVLMINNKNKTPSSEKRSLSNFPKLKNEEGVLNLKFPSEFDLFFSENFKFRENLITINNFITNKKDKFMHGIGLKNIKDTVYKYNGEIKIEFDDDKFVIKFIFSLKNWPVMLIWYPVTHSVLNIKLKKCKFKL